MAPWVFILTAALTSTAAATDGGEPPPFAAVRGAYAPSDACLLDRRGEVVHELRVDATRRRLPWTPVGQISPALVATVLISEDRRYYDHGGVDVRALAAAAWGRLGGKPLRGASTIAMQLTSLLDPRLQAAAGRRGVAQKWAQMRAAWALERAWNKEEILEAYLNLVTFRGELQGVAAASAVLFDKQPHGISAAEAAVLAALLRAPNADLAAVRRRAALLYEQAAGWCVAPPCAAERRAPGSEAALPSALARALDRPRGKGPRIKLASHVAGQLLRPGQARGPVRSTLDAALQRFVRESLRRHLLALSGREVSDGAVLVADNATGEILAYVGSSGDLSPAAEVDGVRARRQAGSTLKPFLYATAIDERLVTPATLLQDSPLELQVGGALYRPRSYDDEYRGLVSVRLALAASLNVPAVRVLQLVGAQRFAQRLRGLGFALDRTADDYGPSLALGSADVTLWELVAAYRALANAGVWAPLTLVPPRDPALEPCKVVTPRADLRPKDRHLSWAAGRARTATTRAVFSPAAAFLAADILADRESRAPTFGLENSLGTRFWSAVKTGTSKDMRDNWCVGFSRRFTVGVWVGNFSGRPMHQVSGVSGAAPIWLEVLEWLHREEPSRAQPAPQGVEVRLVAFAGAREVEREEWFLAGTAREATTAFVAREMPRIVAPAPDAVIAVDPDIPAARQRMPFEALHAEGARWQLDGAVIGPAHRMLWRPAPGRHSLELLDEKGRSLHRVAFLVKGASPASVP